MKQIGKFEWIYHALQVIIFPMYTNLLWSSYAIGFMFLFWLTNSGLNIKIQLYMLTAERVNTNLIFLYLALSKILRATLVLCKWIGALGENVIIWKAYPSMPFSTDLRRIKRVDVCGMSHQNVLGVFSSTVLCMT